MLKESTEYLYVDQKIGDDFIRDASGNAISETTCLKPLKTIFQAVKNANKRRFIGSSNCFIRLLSDIDLYTNVRKEQKARSTYGEIYENIKGEKSIQTIVLYHPDLVAPKVLRLEGWDKDKNTNTVRNINFDVKLLNVLYKAFVLCRACCVISHITFNGGLGYDDFNQTNFVPTGINSSYTVKDAEQV